MIIDILVMLVMCGQSWKEEEERKLAVTFAEWHEDYLPGATNKSK